MWLDHLQRDVRYALRTLAKNRGVAAVAIVTLALGIGANTAIFSVVYGILLRPLPYRDPTRLVLIQRQQDMSGAHRPVPAPFFLPAEIETWQQGLPAFDSTALYSLEVAALSGETGTEVIDSAVVSDSFFSTLAGPIAAGRPLGLANDHAAAVVVSERLSRHLFGGAQAAVGQQVEFSSQSYTIVGVADPAFQFPSPKTDVWMPASFMRALTPRCCGFQMLGRLKRAETVARATAEVATLAKTTSASAPGPRVDVRATVVLVRDQIVGSVRPALLVLFAASSLMLLVSCANVVNLLVARQSARELETAIRSALGASRRRLVGQLMTETMLLAAIGAMIGIGLTTAIVAALRRVEFAQIPRADAVHVDRPVLLFSIGLTALAAAATGILPALRSTKHAIALKSGAASSTNSVRVQRVLCITELAISLVLLVGASLLGRSLVRLMHVDLGISTDHVVTASMNLAFGGRPTDAQVLTRIDRVLERVGTLPGVRAAGVGTGLPPNASRLRLSLRRTGETVDYQAAGVAVTPGYFQALNVRLVEGRLFRADDDLNHPPVMIMSVETARRFFGDRDAIGRTMSLPVSRNGVNGREDMMLVGIIANIKYAGLDAAADDAVYRPFVQQPWVAPFLVAQTARDPAEYVTTIRREIAAVDRAIVVSDVKALDSVVSNAAAQPRFRTALLGVIAGLAVVLATLGLYGLVAYSVGQRTKEFGVRMALGARRSDILGLVWRETLALSLAGIVYGLVGAYAATRGLKGLLFGITATDPLSFALAGLGLLMVTLAASYFPARRATRVDPLIALRYE